MSAARVALAWTLTRPAIASLVVGVRNVGQLEDGLAAVELALCEEDLARLDEVSRLPLIYPYWHQHNFARPRFSQADRALHASYEDRHYGGIGRTEDVRAERASASRRSPPRRSRRAT